MKSLRPELNSLIQEWIDQAGVPCTKSYTIEKSPIRIDEFCIEFSIKLDDDLGPKVTPMTIKKIFYTFAQNDPKANPNGDVYNLDLFLKRLDTEVQERFNSML